MSSTLIIAILIVVLLVAILLFFFMRSRQTGRVYQSSTKSIEEVFADLPSGMYSRLGKTRSTFATTLTRLRGKSTVDPSFWKSIEEMLLLSDVGVITTEYICSEAMNICDKRMVSDVDEALEAVKSVMLSMFHSDREPNIGQGTNVWLFVGVNGVGKTTSIAKLAQRYRGENKTVLLVAADTFRAAAAEQLELWATRTGADIVRSHEGADPASVVYDGMEKANAKQYEIVLVDTAGRLHTKNNLMEEIKKIRRVIERTKGILKEVLIVIDASTGQNGLIQAQEFNNTLDVTGVVLTKLDGSSKGGIVLSVEHDLGLPVKWVGLGEGPLDLMEFSPKEYVSALLD